MEVRECPYCHKRISILRCSRFLFRGTNYTILCNNCNKEVKLLKEPIPFIYTVFAGALVSYLSMQFFIYFMKLDFLNSLFCSIPVFVLGELVVMVIILKKIRFIKAKEIR